MSTRSTSIRVIVLLLLFISAGAIINVAVAWRFLVTRPTLRSDDSPITPPPFATELLAANPRWKKNGGPYFDCFRETGYRIIVINDPSPVAQQFTYASVGLPAIALEGARITTEPFSYVPGVPDTVESSRGALQLPARWRNGFESFLPIRPVWPGFAINTIFYGAALWLVFCAGHGFVSRRIRRKRRRRGQCLHCGYDLRGQAPPPEGQSTKCPECGRSATQYIEPHIRERNR